LLQFLNEKKIWTRLLFAWNYCKQPAFLNYVKEYRIVGTLEATDYVMCNTFWLGVYPGLDKTKLDTIILSIKEFIWWKNL
jgi:CDP-6-deoxy-D-xylo-4-hexulose-3-dehydrase